MGDGIRRQFAAQLILDLGCGFIVDSKMMSQRVTKKLVVSGETVMVLVQFEPGGRASRNHDPKNKTRTFTSFDSAFLQHTPSFDTDRLQLADHLIASALVVRNI